jgi:hypothetical protein
MTDYIDSLKSKGFTQSQVDALKVVVSEAIHESISNMIQNVATKEDQEFILKENETLFDEFKTDMESLGKKDFTGLQDVLENTVKDVEKIKSSMRDDISRIHGGVRLDINLEQARIKDESVFLPHSSSHL